MSPVKKIEDKGFTAKVIHLRKFELPAAGVFYGTRKDHPAVPPRPEGGTTMVIVKDSEGNRIASGQARCSDNDNYNKSLGVLIAAGRA